MSQCLLLLEPIALPKVNHSPPRQIIFVLPAGDMEQMVYFNSGGTGQVTGSPLVQSFLKQIWCMCMALSTGMCQCVGGVLEWKIRGGESHE